MHYKRNIFFQIVHLFRSHSHELQNDDIASHKLTGYMTLQCCAADFSLLNLPKGKSLGRSKPTTNS
jgi:hypothetical protein